AGVGAESAQARARGDGRARAATGAGREALGVPRIAASPVVRIVGGAAPGELVQIRLADDERAGPLEARDDRGVLVGHEIAEDLRARRRPDPERLDVY